MPCTGHAGSAGCRGATSCPRSPRAGFRAVAPDLRGYGKSDKPQGLDAYRIEVLARDVTRLVEALGAERAHVVGHD